MKRSLFFFGGIFLCFVLSAEPLFSKKIIYKQLLARGYESSLLLAENPSKELKAEALLKEKIIPLLLKNKSRFEHMDYEDKIAEISLLLYHQGAPQLNEDSCQKNKDCAVDFVQMIYELADLTDIFTELDAKGAALKKLVLQNFWMQKRTQEAHFRKELLALAGDQKASQKRLPAGKESVEFVPAVGSLLYSPSQRVLGFISSLGEGPVVLPLNIQRKKFSKLLSFKDFMKEFPSARSIDPLFKQRNP